MTIRILLLGALFPLLAALLAIVVVGPAAASDIPPSQATVAQAASDAEQERLITNTPKTNMSAARLARFTGSDEMAAGDECPIGSGAYCSDTSPYCFLCRGEYACCWSREVWRCCD